MKKFFLITLSIFFNFYFLYSENVNRKEILLSRIYIENNNYKKSIEILLKQLKKEPNNIRILLQLGYSYFNLGYYKKSLYCYNKILELDKNIEAINMKTIILKEIHRYFIFGFENYTSTGEKNFNKFFELFLPLKQNYYLKIKNQNFIFYDNSNFNNINFKTKKSDINIILGYKLINNFGYNLEIKKSESFNNLKYGITFFKNFNSKSFKISLTKNNIWKYPVDAILYHGNYNSLKFSQYLTFNQKYFFSYDYEYRNYYIFKNQKYGNGKILNFSIGKMLFYNSSDNKKFNNYINTNISFYKVNNNFKHVYSKYINLSSSINQLSLNLNFGYEINKKNFFESNCFLAQDKSRNINFANIYGINFKITTILSSRIQSIFFTNYSSENSITTGNTTNINWKFLIYY